MDDDMQTFLLNLISALFFVHLISFGICCTSFIWHTDMVTTTYFGMVLLSKEQPHSPSLSAYLLEEGAVNERTFCQYCSIHPGNKTVNATATLTSSAVDGFGKAKTLCSNQYSSANFRKTCQVFIGGSFLWAAGVETNREFWHHYEVKRPPHPPTFPKPFTLARTHARIPNPPSPILDPHIQTLKGHYLQYKLQYNTSLKNMRSLKTYRSSWQKKPKNQLFSKLGSYGIMWKIIIIKKQKQSDSLTAPLWGVRSVWPQLYLASMLKVRWRMGLVDHAHIFSSFVWKQAAIQRITLDPISQYVQFCFVFFVVIFTPGILEQW